ncbi:MAG: insulinase family protein [Chloroflexi bacterium]|nr:MAG: insulinase family protein [Chloroflexota bacterium]
MDVRRRTLANGLRVVVAPIPGLRSVAVLLAIEAGQWFEPAGRPGIARLCALAMLRGTTTRDAKTWADAIDALGASARLDVGSHAAVFSAQSLGDDLGALLDLMADAVIRPALAEREVELVRAQTLAQIEEDARNTRAVAERAWRELVYPPGHPFHARAIGDAAVVRSATAEEIRGHHGQAIRPGGAVLVLAGGIDPKRAGAAGERAFGAWEAKDGRTKREVRSVALAAAVRRLEVVPDKTQSDVIIGWPGLPRNDPRFVAARVTNMVYAADTFASRAGHVIRDQLGLAYYVFSAIGASRGQSPWIVRMGVNPQNVRRAIDVALDELRKITVGQIADDDLAVAKDKLEAELFDLGPDHFERYPRELRAVTRDQVVETARSFLPPDRHALAIAGPPLPEAA